MKKNKACTFGYWFRVTNVKSLKKNKPVLYTDRYGVVLPIRLTPKKSFSPKNWKNEILLKNIIKQKLNYTQNIKKKKKNVILQKNIIKYKLLKPNHKTKTKKNVILQKKDNKIKVKLRAKSLKNIYKNVPQFYKKIIK